MQRVIDIPGYGEVEFPDSMSDQQVNEAAKRLYREGQAKAAPTDDRTVGQVAKDQALNVVRGAPKAVTGIPGALMEIGGAAKDMVLGKGSERMGNLITNAATGTIEPFQVVTRGAFNEIVERLPESWRVPVRGSVEMIAPGINKPPGMKDYEQAAEAGGTMLAGELIGAGLAKALPAVSSRASSMAKTAKQQIINKAQGAPSVNKWMQVEPKELIHGANPGQQLKIENLIASTKEATKANIQPALKDAGSKMQAKLSAADAAGKIINAEKPVLKGLLNVQKTIGLKSDKAFNAQLSNYFDDILNKYPNLDNLTPSQAHALKVEIGDAIKWHGAAYEGPINGALVEIYGELNKAIKTAAPGISDDMTRWGNLYQADRALEKAISYDTAGRGTGSMTKHLLKKAGKTAGAVGLGAGGVIAAHQLLD